MDAILLSAGKGERLWPLTKNTPKALLDLGNGETLIENQLATLQACPGIERVYVVGGYRVEQIEAKLAHYEGIPVEVVYNPFFDRTNNLVSLWLGLLAVPSKEAVTINGDDLFQPPIVRGLLAAPQGHDICMVIDRPRRPLNDDDMKVVTRGDQVLEVSKKVPLERANGESIGMIRWQERGLRVLRQTLDRLVRTKPALDWYYLAAVQAVIDQGFPVHYFECAEDQWCEVDFHRDLKDLRQLVATESFWLQAPAGEPVAQTR